MTTGFVLIFAILVLGGVIATVGDRIGMRVGKARLSLFNLRPRQTATLISILTGGIISISTLAILFLIDGQLRTGVFELREIQDDLATAREDLQETQAEKNQIESELDEAIAQQNTAQRRLRRINRSLDRAITRQERTERQLEQTRTALDQIDRNYRDAREQLRTASTQAAQLRADIASLQRGREVLIAERDQQIAQRDREIAQRDAAIAERETRLRNLEDQQAYLQQEIDTLERQYQGLRQGNVALLRNQTLASSGVFRVTDPNGITDVLPPLLLQANRNALAAIYPGTPNENRLIIRVSNTTPEDLISQVREGQEYVIRVFSSGNYVVGEPCVLVGESCIDVFVSAIPYRLVFQRGEVLATTSVNPRTMTDVDLVERYTFLISASQFRVRQAGTLADLIRISDSNPETLRRFFEQLRHYNQAIEIQAVTADEIYTVSETITIELVATLQGRVLFSTADMREPPDNTSPTEEPETDPLRN